MNWYKTSKNESFNKKSPFKIVMYNGVDWSPIVGLETETTYAYSPQQAMFLFVKKFPKIKDYQEMGFDIDVVLDEESIANEIMRSKSEKDRRKKIIDDAWWNK